jgi:Zn-dependent protease with chaperone function
MKQRELRAILAHEFGHFRNPGGGAVLSVRRSLSALIAGMGRSRVATVLNPAWWFVRAFTHLYNVVSTGASRLQEVLADRQAIRAYGSDAFVAGARHVVAREVEFAQDLAQTIKDVLENKWSLPNLYAYDPDQKKSAAARAAAVATKLDREPGRFDSHPSWRERISWAEQLALPGEASCPEGDAPVWNLFPDPERVERTMTAIIRARIQAKFGVTVSDAEWQDDEPAAS